MNAASFLSLVNRSRTAGIALAGETVTIGTWTGLAIVKGGPRYLADAVGGTYAQDALTLSVNKSDLAGFIPFAQMQVTARGKALRIPDNGIVEYRDRYSITVAGRQVPAR
jgi:hypothetical protein